MGGERERIEFMFNINNADISWTFLGILIIIIFYFVKYNIGGFCWNSKDIMERCACLFCMNVCLIVTTLVLFMFSLIGRVSLYILFAVCAVCEILDFDNIVLANFYALS